MDITQTLARRFLLAGGGVFLILSGLSILTLFAAPLAVMALLVSVISAGVLLRRRTLVTTAAVIATVTLVVVIAWWITWGEAFTYADANRAVPAALAAVVTASGVLAALGALAILGMWVWLLATVAQQPRVTTA